MTQRLTFVRDMQSNFFGPLNAGNQYRAIEGVTTLFINQGIGVPESWISYIDAGIVEAIQRGGAIALGKPHAAELASRTGGAQEWATFLRKMKDGSLVNDRDVRIQSTRPMIPDEIANGRL